MASTMGSERADRRRAVRIGSSTRGDCPPMEAPKQHANARAEHLIPTRQHMMQNRYLTAINQLIVLENGMRFIPIWGS